MRICNDMSLDKLKYINIRNYNDKRSPGRILFEVDAVDHNGNDISFHKEMREFQATHVVLLVNSDKSMRISKIDDGLENCTSCVFDKSVATEVGCSCTFFSCNYDVPSLGIKNGYYKEKMYNRFSGLYKNIYLKYLLYKILEDLNSSGDNKILIINISKQDYEKGNCKT